MSTLLIFILVLSKVFYISIFKLDDFNFTLSDACFVMFIVIIAIRFLMLKDIRDIYDSEIYGYLRRMLVFAVGAFVLNIATTIAIAANPFWSILHIFKRWLSMLIIPFYFSICVKSKVKVIFICSAVLLVYAIWNYGNIVSSNADRYYGEDGFNPNIVGGTFGLLMVYVINSKYNNFTKILVSVISVFMIFACSTRSAILSVVVALMGVKFSKYSLSDALDKIKSVVIYGALAIIGLYVCTKIIPTATERIVESFRGGLTKTSSYVARMDVARDIAEAFRSHLRLMLFGTGFGSRNQAYIFRAYGYDVQTSDNMYIEMLCWVGSIGVPFVVLYLKDLCSIVKRINKQGYISSLAITIYIFALGFTQSALFEPTVGAIYYILFSFDMIRAMDKEEAQRMLAEEAEAAEDKAT